MLADVVTADKPLIVTSHLPSAPYFAANEHDTFAIRCESDFDYWDGMQEAWQHDGTIVVIEHDMEVSDGLVAELLDCPEPLCTHAYTLYWVSTGKEAHYAHHNSGMWVSEGCDVAEYSGIGFCKLTRAVRGPLLRRDPEHPMHWATVDIAVNKAVARSGQRWHVHWPGVDHHHY